MRLALIGYGSIARQALGALAETLPTPLEAVICLAREKGANRARDLLESFGGKLARQRQVVSSVAELQQLRPVLVAEAAGHGALKMYGADVLQGGADLIVTSVGALADGELRGQLDAAARKSGASYHLCPGAVGGLDLLAAAKLSGLDQVVYTSRKPPKAWMGSPAEQAVDLAALTSAHVFYEGTASAAARDYPQNANVAATVALVGAGFDATQVRLIADPAVSRNIHEISVRSKSVDFELRIEGRPSPDNPKTSLTTGFALARQLLDNLKLSRP